MDGSREDIDVLLLTNGLLPKNFALKSVTENKYLRYVSDKDAAARLGFLQVSCAADGILQDPNVRFAVEEASTETGSRLVHIRSCYSNKYWRRSSEDENWFVASAEAKEEDKSKWSCTLFEAERHESTDDGKTVIRLRHVQSGHYVTIFSPTEEFLYGSSAKPAPERCDLFIVTNWASLVPLPKYIAFKGNNDKFLNQCRWMLPRALMFNSGDAGEEGVTLENIAADDGNIRLKGFKFDPYMVKYTAWDYLATYEPCSITDGALFQPTMIDKKKNLIALKYLGNNKFCRRNKDKDEMLLPDTSIISEEAKLELHEAVISRSLTISYRLEDARMYDMTPITMDSIEHENHDVDPIKKTVTLVYKNEVTTSFEASNSWTAGVSVSIEVDVIPFISSASIELSGSYGETKTWGETKTEGREITESDEYTIKGKHKLIVRKVATRGHCDVPYSYIQTDTLVDSTMISTEKSDGVFRGVNCFDLQTESYQVPL